ncbi:MAG TPA: acyl transferase [Flavipsychrobacter sp.]|nr:acyl transferase [Flavipsychrobacter sp.]
MYNFEAADSQYIDKLNAENFDDIALALFRYQYEENKIYRHYADALRIDPATIKIIEQIPFLPISFFKTHKVVANHKKEPSLIFESSGTTGELTSKHFVFNKILYSSSLLKGFKAFYKDVSQYAILALLPSYLERQNASLVHMAKVLMEQSGHPANGFYLNEWKELKNTIQHLEQLKQPVILLGVTFALLDFAEAFPFQMKHTTVMETGGMKGRGKELTRKEVHDFLKKQWGLRAIHSEYGMTELLSQAYAMGNGILEPTPSMKVLVRDINDPLETQKTGNGCLNIIDLANVESCAFIATEDIGIVHTDGKFEVLGRMDHAALRGCSLLVI